MIFSRKNLIRIIRSSLFGILLVWLWLKFVNLGEIVQRLHSVKFKFILLFFVFFIVSTSLRAIRLKLLLNRYRLSLKELIPLNFLAQFLSFIIPIRAGEIARSIYLSNLTKENWAKSLIWVFLDRFLDFWVLVVLAVFLGSVIPSNLPPQSFKLLLILMLGFSLAAGIIIISSSFAKKLALGLRLKFAVSIIEQFGLFKRPPIEFLGLLGLTALAIFSDMFIWFFTMLSLGVNLGLLKTLFGASLSILTFAIPSAPGYVGSAEAAGLAVFSGVLGMESNLASSAVVLNHILIAIALPIFGIISLYILKFDLGLVWKKLSSKGR